VKQHDTIHYRQVKHETLCHVTLNISCQAIVQLLISNLFDDLILEENVEMQVLLWIFSITNQDHICRTNWLVVADFYSVGRVAVMAWDQTIRIITR
jgi:hypothetical protein